MAKGKKPLVLFLKRMTDVAFWIVVVVIPLNFLIDPLPSLLSSNPERTGLVSTHVTVGKRPFLPTISLESVGQADILSPELKYGSGDLFFRTSRNSLLLANYFTKAFYFLISLIGLKLISRMLGTVLEGRPFDRLNVRRLLWLGWLQIGMSFAIPLIENLQTRMILHTLQFEGLPLSPPFSIWVEGIESGLFTLVLSAVCAYGAEMERDRSLTV